MYFKQTEALSRNEVQDLTDAQYRAAERGYFGLLRRKRISRQFIERHGEDLFGQALFEYTRMIHAGKEIRKPVAWIVLCAWSRTIRELESSNWRPRMVSTDSVAELSADAIASPDEAFLTEDRYRKVRKAIEDLPEYQRELLNRSYFEGKSIREAARELGWTPSKAQRAHEAAQRGLRQLLGPKDLLGIPAGLAAVLGHLRERALELLRRPFGKGGSAAGATPPGNPEALGDLGRRAVTEVDHGPISLAARAGRRVSDLGRRMLSSGGVESTAAAADGGARFAEACKAIAAVCVIGTGAVGGAALLGSGHDHHRPARSPDQHRVASSERRSEKETGPLAPDSASATPATASQSQAASNTASDQDKSSPTRIVSGDTAAQPTPAQRRALHHHSEEVNAEESFDGMAKAAAEAEQVPAETAGSQAVSSAEPQPASSGGETDSSVSAPASPKVRTEEAQTKTQFQGGLP